MKINKLSSSGIRKKWKLSSYENIKFHTKNNFEEILLENNKKVLARVNNISLYLMFDEKLLSYKSFINDSIIKEINYWYNPSSSTINEQWNVEIQKKCDKCNNKILFKEIDRTINNKIVRNNYTITFISNIKMISINYSLDNQYERKMWLISLNSYKNDLYKEINKCLDKYSKDPFFTILITNDNSRWYWDDNQDLSGWEWVYPTLKILELV